MTHKSGFVNIIGHPNVGKSTLMNQLMGEKLSIISPKAQTTRHRIQGIFSGDDFQIVYSDTPGILTPAYKMQEGMMQFVESAFIDADVLLLMTEVGEHRIMETPFFQRVKRSAAPVLVLINKIDLSDQETVEKEVAIWKEALPESVILPLSALHGANIDQVMKTLLEILPEGPAYFLKDEMTDKPMRFFMSEIIREKIFFNYQKEVPYSCEVVIEAFKEGPERIDIRAEIYVARNSQKGIVIGHQGKMLKKVGTQARKDMEAFLGKQVFLEIYVKVDKDWRNRSTSLKRFGYLQ